MLSRLLIATLFSLSLSATQYAGAHHAYAANYDVDSVGTVEGVVEEVVWTNPHVHFYLRVTKNDGSTELWDGEAGNLNSMAARNWNRNTVRVGDEIQVTGMLGREGRRRIQMREVITADGTPIP